MPSNLTDLALPTCATTQRNTTQKPKPLLTGDEFLEGWIWQAQPWARAFYNHIAIQMFVAGLIFCNFIINAAEAEVLPDEDERGFFYYSEWFFNTVFAVELVLNMYAHWLRRFWRDPWNWFDFIVVMVGLISLALDSLPGIDTLRLMRAFRVFRLFKRLESLRKIIRALEAATVGVMNAFAVLLLVVAIYAILGVQFFGRHEMEYFGTFARAMFTLFQVGGSTGVGAHGCCVA